MKLQAGYILEDLKNALGKAYGDGAAHLLSGLSVFEYQVNTLKRHQLDEKFKPHIKVLKNLIGRGNPTRMTLPLEQSFASITDAKEIDRYGTVLVNHEISDELRDLCFRALHVIDPRFDSVKARSNYVQSWENLDSRYEEDFLFNSVPQVLGPDLGKVAVQLFDTQRSIQELTDRRFSQEWLGTSFNQQRADFVLEFPTPIENHKGFIVEVDGAQHEETRQERLDARRDEATHQHGWNSTIRIKTTEWEQINSKLRPILETLYGKHFEPFIENLNDPLHETAGGLKASTIALSPFAIARVQRAVIEMIQSGHLNMNSQNWKIAVFERDVPCGHWAFDDLTAIVKNLFMLTEDGFSLPNIELTVIRTDEYKNSPVKEDFYMGVEEAKQSTDKFDALIDVSMLRRDTIMDEDILNFNASVSCVIRSSKNSSYSGRVETDDHLKYRPLVKRLDAESFKDIEEQRTGLEFFLQWVFRKRSFRPGQLPILDRALRRENVIGLLPTGGGKSLTYQLAAVMQPGVTLIVDPIKSLMKDQVDGLSANLISSSVFINSSVKGEERARAEEMLSNGERQFIFVSPERLQITSFRQLLKGMHAKGVYFNYCVIDEAHCVSEWGHDFRTSYLSLGENIRKYCKTASESDLPLFGLTATASFDVLADVQRELSPIHGIPISDEAVVRQHSTKRPELQFRVLEVLVFDELIEEDFDRMSALQRTVAVAVGKKSALQKLLNDFPYQLKQFNEDPSLSYSKEELEDEANINQFKQIQIDGYNPTSFFKPSAHDNSYAQAGVVFCPHGRWHFGVTDKYEIPPRNLGVAESIQIPAPFGTYLGANDDNDEVNARIERDNAQNQTAFKENKIALLVATKAFGMGIDKPNIRYAVHFNYPQSIESFVQEAGRAGRDGKLAVGHILFNDEPVFTTEIRDSDQSTAFGWEEEVSGHVGYKKVKVPQDVSLLLDFHNRSFQGEDKEKWTIHELLTEILSPSGARMHQFQSSLPDDFEIKCNAGDHLLFVRNADGNQCGGISWAHLNFNTAPGITEIPAGEALKVLEVVKEHLLVYVNENEIEDLAAWFANDRGSCSDGLESKLEQTELGNRFELDVSFATDKHKIASQISNLIHSTISLTFEANIILGHYKKSFNKFTNFLDGLVGNHTTFRQALTENPEFAKKIEARYCRFREKSDTEKAIYRLQCLGVIDDYSVNYNSSNFRLSGIKKPDGAYSEALKSYIKRYYSDSRAEKELSDLQERKGSTELQKCVNLLIDFVYREIERKRFVAISAMRQACLIGTDKTHGNILFKEFIDLYFFSKYARSEFETELEIDGNSKLVNASLLDRTNQGRESKVDWIWEFIRIAHYDRSGAQLDNFKHLRGACTRILTSNPSNYTLLILQSFAQFFIELNAIEPSSRQLELARDSFLGGFRVLGDVISENETNKIIRSFSTELRNALGELAWKMEEYFDPCLDLYWLEKNRIWTEAFNTRFDYGNERVDSRRTEEIKN